jgi:hypothetical protein
MAFIKMAESEYRKAFLERKKVNYPADHKPGMRVPKGGSMCANCKYLKDADKGLCGNEYFVQWNGSEKIPGPIDSYCSDWWGRKD